MNDDGVSDSEEEILVYAEFGDSVNIDQYRSIHVLGVNQSNPMFQLDDTFFTGKYENPLGTFMFFEEDPAAQSSDPVFDRLSEKNVKYVCKTQKYLNMEHAYVSSKEGKDQSHQSQESQPDDEIEVVNFKTVQEALQKFQNITNHEQKQTSTTPEHAEVTANISNQ
ncbi:uncharacterized protein ACR2FA_012388 [Aphomia sociella]